MLFSRARLRRALGVRERQVSVYCPLSTISAPRLGVALTRARRLRRIVASLK